MMLLFYSRSTVYFVPLTKQNLIDQNSYIALLRGKVTARGMGCQGSFVYPYKLVSEKMAPKSHDEH